MLEPANKLPDKEKNKRNSKQSSLSQVVATITLHTQIANSFFNASWKPGNIGLVQFSLQTAKIYKASQADDPYADWYLMKTYDAIVIAKERLNKIGKEIVACFAGECEIKLQHATNKPWLRELRIFSPFSYMGARLLTDFDQVLRQFIIMRHISKQIGNDISVKKPISELEAAFSLPFAWRETKVTRVDIYADNQKALDAKTAYNTPLPNEVLDKKIEFSYLPNPKITRKV